MRIINSYEIVMNCDKIYQKFELSYYILLLIK